LCSGKAHGAVFRHSDALPNCYVQCNFGKPICSVCPANQNFDNNTLICTVDEEW